MRACLAVVVGLVGILSSMRAEACPVEAPDLIASSGRILAELPQGDGYRKTFVKAVPPRPSLYFHPGSPSRGMPQFVDAAGAPLPYRVVASGIDQFPWRFDFALERGTIHVAHDDTERYEIVPTMRPRTRAVTLGREHHGVTLTIESDAALLRFDRGHEVWVAANRGHVPYYIRDNDSRVTAIYADRTEEVIHEPIGPLELTEPDRRLGFLALALAVLGLGVLGLVGRAALRHQRVSKPSVP